MGQAYSFNLGYQFEFAGGGLTILPLDPNYRWVVRSIDGIGINPVYLDAALEFSYHDARWARFVCPPNGVIPIAWRGRYVVPNDLVEPGPPPYLPVEALAIGDLTSMWDFSLSGYRLELP